MTPINPMLDRLQERLNAPRDSASLAVFRMLYGVLMSASALRFIANGRVERYFGERTFLFKYWGFGWVEHGPVWSMYAAYALLAGLGLCIALGLFYRVAIVLFFLLFSYVELTDVTNYLNHYYLVSLLALLMSFMPLHARWSVDAWRRPALTRLALPAWMLSLVRFQVATVYLGAALAKLGSDWLVHGQPLNLWLSAHADLPWVGPYLGLPAVAVLASWGGFLHDLLVVPLLLWSRTRAYAFAALVGFHALTSTWFNIGIFPVLMPLAATLFFAPNWPLQARARLAQTFGITARAATNTGTGTSTGVKMNRLSRAGCALLVAYCAFQVVMPLRSHFYGGNVLWHEQGMRWSWRVMLRDKHGSISYRVRLENGREARVPPRRYLTSDQEREMSGQPDLILQLAHHIAADFAQRGLKHVQVRVDALVSLNGRAPVPMIDPQVDLAQIDDGIRTAGWILSPPRVAPVPLAPRVRYASVDP